MMKRPLIGIIGDYNPGNPTHVATTDGITHAATSMHEAVDAKWLATDFSDLSAQVQDCSGLFISPGSPYRDMDAVLKVIRFARTANVPLIGTCGGFQHLVIEYARNVVGFKDAQHAEIDPYASTLFITRLACSLVGQSLDIQIQPCSKASFAYGGVSSATEDFYCNFGLAPEHASTLTQAGLTISGKDSNGEARIVEVPEHPFFMGTLFVPQSRSKPDAPHPLILEFVRQCRAFHRG